MSPDCHFGFCWCLSAFGACAGQSLWPWPNLARSATALCPISHRCLVERRTNFQRWSAHYLCVCKSACVFPINLETDLHPATSPLEFVWTLSRPQERGHHLGTGKAGKKDLPRKMLINRYEVDLPSICSWASEKKRSSNCPRCFAKCMPRPEPTQCTKFQEKWTGL